MINIMTEIKLGLKKVQIEYKMKIEQKEYRTIWFENNIVKIIDQTKLPHRFVIKDIKTIKDAVNAI